MNIISSFGKHCFWFIICHAPLLLDFIVNDKSIKLVFVADEKEGRNNEADKNVSVLIHNIKIVVSLRPSTLSCIFQPTSGCKFVAIRFHIDIAT